MRKVNRQFGNGYVSSIQRGLIISDRQFVKLRYPDTLSPSITISTAIAFATRGPFHLNGLWDTDSFLGNVPIPGFADWSHFYRNYRVHSAKIKVTACNTAELENDQDHGRACYFGMVAFAPNANPTAAITTWSRWRNVIEGNKYGRMSLLPSHGSNNKTTLKMYCDFGRMLGVHKQYDSEVNYVGTCAPNVFSATGSNPAYTSDLQLFVGTADGSVLGGATNVHIWIKLEITYYVEFFTRITHTDS